jgi:hypothetical protein
MPCLNLGNRAERAPAPIIGRLLGNGRAHYPTEAGLRLAHHIAERLVCATLVAGVLLGVAVAQEPAPTPTSVHITGAYVQGKLVQLTAEAPKHARRIFTAGPWTFGALIPDRKPKDKRPNLYVVAPGTQYHNEQFKEYDHNIILSGLPTTADEVDWDVYWAIVLDPALRADFRDERELIVAAQDGFAPGDRFDSGDIPGAAFLRSCMHIQSVDDLQSFRRADGTLPRLIIVPAGFLVRASAVDPDAPPPAGRVARAWSRLSRHRRTAPSTASEH